MSISTEGRLGRRRAFNRVLFRSAQSGARMVLDALMPPVCSACQTPLCDHNTLCAECWNNILFIRPPVCDVLGTPLPYDIGERAVSAAAAKDPPVYDRARAVAAYEGTVRELIHGLKFRDQQIAIPLFARWLALAAKEITPPGSLIIPVPLSRRRLWQRRYNQAAILSRALADQTGLRHHPLVLKRVRNTVSQIGLTRAQRETNVSGAFRIAKRHAPLLADRTIVLVDDVVTTGATVSACARTLKRAGAAHVNVLSLARALPERLLETMELI